MRWMMEKILAAVLVIGFIAAAVMLLDAYFDATRDWGENCRRKR